MERVTRTGLHWKKIQQKISVTIVQLSFFLPPVLIFSVFQVVVCSLYSSNQLER